MFDISLGDEAPQLQDEGYATQLGEIVLGDYRDTFLAPLDQWSVTEYRKSWLEAAEQLVAGADRSGFFTQANWMRWVLYREGEKVFVQEHILFELDVDTQVLIKTPAHLIRDRRTTDDDDGEAVSEWEITMAAVRDFVARAKSRELEARTPR